MHGNTDADLQSLDSEKKLQSSEKQVTSKDLPKNVSMQLFNLMNKVVEDQVNPDTVRAACNCATEIHRMLKLNLEMKKIGE